MRAPEKNPDGDPSIPESVTKNVIPEGITGTFEK
jgi:hypothetical protein